MESFAAISLTRLSVAFCAISISEAIDLSSISIVENEWGEYRRGQGAGALTAIKNLRAVRRGLRAAPRRSGIREQLSSAVARDRRQRAAGGDLHRAILELGNFPERIEHRIRQQVCRGLVIAERNEQRATRSAIVGPRIERDRAAPR